MTYHPPVVEPYVSMANETASETPILDASTRLVDLGVQLHSNGRKAWIGGDDYRRVPADLHATVRQCAFRLGRMNGKTERATP
jgi:hypothetical protein